MVMDIKSLGAVSDAHANQTDTLIARLIKQLLGIWSSPASWYNENIIQGQAAQSVQLVQSAQVTARTLTRSYATTILTDLNAMPKKLPASVNYYPRPGVSPLDVYARPAVQYQWVRSQGGTVDDAIDAALSRLQDVATSDVKLAERDEIGKIYDAAPKVVGYRRVIHPELSRTGTCGLCAVAATRFYKKADLLPLHYPSCHCDTMPIVKGDDPGFRLNADDLKQVYAAAGNSTAADDLRNTRITINEHGELGPVLTKDGDNFKTAKEAGRPEWVKPTPDVIRSRQEANVENTQRSLTLAQDALNAYIAENPASQPGDAPRLALFRATKNLSDLLAAQQLVLKRSTK